MKEVIFTGCSEDQKRWGNHTGDTSKLIVGNKYQVEKEEVHCWHTKVFLIGFEGSYNSVCFKEQTMNVCEVIEAKKESEKLILEIIKSLEQKTEMTVGNIDFVYGHKATEKFQKIEIVSIDLSI